MDAFQQHPRDHHQEQVMQDNRKCLAYRLQGRDKQQKKKLKVVYQNQARIVRTGELGIQVLEKWEWRLKITQAGRFKLSEFIAGATAPDYLPKHGHM